MTGWRIATVRGIPITLHWLFLVFVGLLLFVMRADGETSVLSSAMLLVITFGTVLLHELAHAVVAQRYGIAVRGITLFPFGGVALMDRIPEDPRQEAAIAAAGPAFNVAVAAATFAFIYYLPGVEFLVDPYRFYSMADVLENPTLFTRGVVMIYKINAALAVFNLAPAIPMDGGRLLRAGLVARGLPYARATALAVRVARACFVLFGLIGLATWSIMLTAIAMILWAAAGAEERHAETRDALRHLTVAHLLPQDPVGVEPATELGELVPVLVRGEQRHFPVVSRGRIEGVLWHGDLVEALTRPGGPDRTAGSLMRPPLVAGPSDPLSAVARRLDETGAPVAVVLEGGRLTGLVSRETLATLIERLRSAAD